MKKWIALILSLVLALGLFASAAGAETFIKPDMDMKVKKPASTANNPVIAGEDPYTGLPTDVDAFTPILQVFDGAEEAFPHWGIGSASVVLEIPNDSFSNCKLLGLFTSEFPELAGGTRSARMCSLVFANVFNSIYISAGPGMAEDGNGNNIVETQRKKWSIYSEDVRGIKQRYWNMLGNDSLKVRTSEVVNPHNLLVRVDKIHELASTADYSFEARPFLFTDEALTRGDEAAEITLDFSNSAANCRFEYSEDDGGYLRWSKMGSPSNPPSINYDRATQEELVFANVIVMRSVLKNNRVISYDNNLVGGGQADIFQNGRHIQGTWYRADEYSRLIFMDENGNELEFQRGKTFIAVNNATLVVSYE